MFSKHISKTANVNNKLIIIINNVTLTTIKTLDNLLGRANMHEVVYPAQTTIAKEVGTTRETVNRSISHLVELNLIKKTTRLWNSCIYEINPELNDPELRWQLRHLFKAFKMRPLIPLLLIPAVMASDIKENNSFHKHMSHHISLSYSYPSPNNHLSNINHQYHNQRSSIEEEGNNKDTISTTSRKPHINNDYSLKKETAMLAKIKAELGLGDYEISQLQTFDEDILAEGYKGLLKTPNVTNKFKFLMACCNNAKTKPRKKPAQEVRKPVAWVNKEPTKVRTLDDILRDIENFKSATMPTFMTGEGMLFSGFKENMLKNLEEELLKFNQESAMLNESVSAQQNIQQIKNDSPMVKLDIKSVYEEKYKDHEQIDQIKAWLQTVVVDDGNYEEVYD